MGVYIKGQKMPGTCNDCEFLDLDTFDYEMHIACGLTGEIVTYDLRHGRNEKCPLIEVIEPHGRLIDANVLARKIVESNYGVDFINKTMALIMDTQTVIEAEGE